MTFPIIPGGSPSTSYQISRSLRFRSSASAYLNRTPSSAGNRRTWTWSGWLKLGSITANGYSIFGGGTPASNWGGIEFDGTNGVISVRDYNGSSNDYQILGTPYYRDYSAWYHLVVKFDDTQATSANRLIIYINGSAIAVSGTYPAQNTDYRVNSAAEHRIMRYMGGAANYMDGYLAEVNFIDGQALTPSSFGEYDATTGVWGPKACTVTDYGKNGFYLPFSDSANIFNDKAAIATNHSAANNWTASGLQTTSSTLTTYDYMIDSPTNYADGGNGRGNYCVLSPLDINASNTQRPTDGNLTYPVSSAVQYSARGTIFVTSGKWYAEFTISSSAAIVAVVNSSAILLGYNAVSGIFTSTTSIYNNGTQVQSGLAAFSANDVIGVAFDADANTVQFYRNGSTYGTAVTISAFSGPFTFQTGANGATCTINANFGQRPFAFTVPSGFLALNTQNLPTPTIKNGAQYMAATTYIGTSASNPISNGSNNTLGTTFQPDFVWIKNRNYASGTNHVLIDSVRGISNGLASNLTNGDFSTTGNFSSINPTGFTVAGTARDYNFLNDTFVGWQWRAGGTGVSNTSGSITSTVSANVTAGFSVVTYTGNGTSGATVGHGLGVTPSMIIVKRRDASAAWDVYHSSIGATGRLYLNTTDSTNTSSAPWNNAAPDNSKFTVGNATDTNNNGSTIVAYCFANVSGYSSAFSYTGNGSSDGPMVFLNFRPRWVMIKRTDTAVDWEVVDTSRDAYNVSMGRLFPNLSNAEATTGAGIDILSNGFKIRSLNNGYNASGGTYIGYAIAENPFRISRAR